MRRDSPGAALDRFYGRPEHALVAKAAHDPTLADFVIACSERYGRGTVRRAVELACGLGLLSVDLARRGVSMTAVDRAPGIVRAAKAQARSEGARVRVRRGDMIRFRARPRVDVVVNLGLNASYVESNAQMARHLASVASSLLPGGLYILELEHVMHQLPGRLCGVDGAWLLLETEPVFVSTAIDRGREVRIEYGSGGVRFDPIRQVFRTRCAIARDGRTVASVDVSGKVYTLSELEVIARASSDLAPVAHFAGTDFNAPLAARPTCARCVVVFRRTRRMATRGT
jgi:SAM-dependent methyltransferase